MAKKKLKYKVGDEVLEVRPGKIVDIDMEDDDQTYLVDFGGGGGARMSSANPTAALATAEQAGYAKGVEDAAKKIKAIKERFVERWAAKNSISAEEAGELEIAVILRELEKELRSLTTKGVTNG